MATAPSNGRRRRVTSYDVAARAGVSQSAVSRSLNPGGSASPEVRARVEAAAKALGYRPNIMARAVTTRRSGLVAVVLFNETNLHFPELLNELVQAVSAAGMRVLLFTIEREDDIDGAVDAIWAYQVDGVIAAARLSPAQIAQFADNGVALIVLNRAPLAPVSAVTCDHRGCGAMVAELLLAAGHRAFGLIGGDAASPVGEERMAGVLDRLRAAGVDDVVQARGDFGYESGRAALGRLAAAGALTDRAIVAASDWMALGALDALRDDHGLLAPRDCSVAGFDGVAAAAWSSHPLTTIEQPVRAMARAAADMLLTARAAPAPVIERRIFTGRLVERSSTRPSLTAPAVPGVWG